MIINLLLASLLTIATFTLIVTLDKSFIIINGVMRKILTLTRRSKKLTTYLLKAYLAYKRNLKNH